MQETYKRLSDGVVYQLIDSNLSATSDVLFVSFMFRSLIFISIIVILITLPLLYLTGFSPMSTLLVLMVVCAVIYGLHMINRAYKKYETSVWVDRDVSLNYPIISEEYVSKNMTFLKKYQNSFGSLFIPYKSAMLDILVLYLNKSIKLDKEDRELFVQETNKLTTVSFIHPIYETDELGIVEHVIIHYLKKPHSNKQGLSYICFSLYSHTMDNRFLELLKNEDYFETCHSELLLNRIKQMDRIKLCRSLSKKHTDDKIREENV